MKISFFSVILLAGFALYIPSNFASAQESIMIDIPLGVASGCEVSNECFIPSSIRIEVGDTVVWTNNDSQPHTITSGSPILGVSGIFSSGNLEMGQTFSHTFSEKGEYPYFSTNGPWMQGTVFVGIDVPSSDLDPEPTSSPKQNEWTQYSTIEDEFYHQTSLNESPVLIRIFNEKPEANEEFQIGLEFVNSKTLEQMSNVNYDLTAVQNGKTVLTEQSVYHSEGRADHFTSPLDSDEPVDIQITMLGIGIPASGPLTSSTGEVVTFTAVPEYGQIAFLVLVLGIVVVIALNSKNKLIKLPNYN